jgi:phage tail sheath protein FI
VQLAYPWARTRGAGALPEGLESPDGVLAGVLARNALERGTFRSAAGQPLGSVVDVHPLLPQQELVAAPAPRHRSGGTRTVAERVSLLGRTPRGMQLLSDVTASGAEHFRPASVHRLVSAVVRAARRVGEDAVFDSSGERMWASVAARIEGVLLALWSDGALRGATPAAAFDVRCDRTTMTQADLDAGRAIAIVRFDPAAPIERITVVLALDAAGSLALPLAALGLAPVGEEVA